LDTERIVKSAERVDTFIADIGWGLGSVIGCIYIIAYTITIIIRSSCHNIRSA
jgi:hypothetical protein